MTKPINWRSSDRTIHGPNRLMLIWLMLDQQIFVPVSSWQYFTYTPVSVTFEKKKKK